MLFNSYAFLFGFLPLTLAGVWLLGRRAAAGAAVMWLLAASLWFYAYWNPPYLGMLVGSVAFNYAIGWVLCDRDAASDRRRRQLLLLGLVGNLLLLVQCKYLGFFAEIAGALAGTDFDPGPMVLPLAISFFTFQQIAFLVDAFRGEVERPSPSRYALFVCFFPQLIAGPIVQHREVLPQLARRGLGRFDAERMAQGLTLFVLGLAKKVVLADRLAPLANPVFDAAAAGEALTFADAWGGALAYTLQLYFDFSGYSDMAVGLGAMVGVKLPRNFDSPYQAASIIDFWRRWHMTLSRFLRNYLYIPLGGNRRGRGRRYANLLLTMLLGGLWHGAGWTFVVWGGVHGLFLVVNHGWRALRSGGRPSSPPSRAAARALTFAAVVVAWVFFRAESLAAALEMLGAMFGLGGAALPGSAGAVPMLGAEPWGGLAALLALVWWAPNTNRVLPVALDSPPAEGGVPRFAWRATPSWAFAVGTLALVAVVDLVKRSEFIYFRF
jgi:D-alanyl-lipoteichoic acid acyltransferase DltB (MBOAT superfamily)